MLIQCFDFNCCWSVVENRLEYGRIIRHWKNSTPKVTFSFTRNHQLHISRSRNEPSENDHSVELKSVLTLDESLSLENFHFEILLDSVRRAKIAEEIVASRTFASKSHELQSSRFSSRLWLSADGEASLFFGWKFSFFAFCWKKNLFDMKTFLLVEAKNSPNFLWAPVDVAEKRKTKHFWKKFSETFFTSKENFLFCSKKFRFEFFSFRFDRNRNLEEEIVFLFFSQWKKPFRFWRISVSIRRSGSTIFSKAQKIDLIVRFTSRMIGKLRTAVRLKKRIFSFGNERMTSKVLIDFL